MKLFRTGENECRIEDPDWDTQLNIAKVLKVCVIIAINKGYVTGLLIYQCLSPHKLVQ